MIMAQDGHNPGYGWKIDAVKHRETDAKAAGKGGRGLGARAQAL
jgi:hypothetical protein